MFETPILFIIFNRPDTTNQVFEAIKKQKPKYLYVAADGPRPGNLNDFDKCKAARDIIKVDWECELKTLYRDENLGCGKGPADAISWFFKDVNQGIILEDDSVPHHDFFDYCSELLKLYEENHTVKTIGSANFQNGKNHNNHSYYFSMQNGCFCSWATWKRTWEEYDYYLNRISIHTLKKSLKYYKVSLKEYIYWIDIFNKVKKDRFNESCWDYQLMFSIWKSKGVGIIPNVNLASNIGFNKEATHTYDPAHVGANKPTESILPLSNPPEIKTDRSADLFYHNYYYQIPKKGKEKIVLLIVIINKWIKSLFNIDKSWINHFSSVSKNIFFKVRKYKTNLKNNWYWNKQGKLLRKKIIQEYNQIPEEKISSDEKEVLDYLKKNKISLLPYEFVKKYRKQSVRVVHNFDNGLKYVNFNDKKLYFRRDWDKKKIRRYFLNLLAEQDSYSPHCYLTDDFNLEYGSVVVDVGSAEGFFSLMVIDKAKKIYVFEQDLLWKEALEATFKPWNEKVTIINKFVSAETNKDKIALDEYFSDIEIDFIKIDVEGNEREVLYGSEKLLYNSHLQKIVLATYHLHNDEKDLLAFLKEKEFYCTFSRGFIAFYYQKRFDPPYLRRCLIRAIKN